MKQEIFCKFSNNRSPQYAIRTVICEEGTDRWVEKHPVWEAARPHIHQLERSCAMLAEQYAGTGLSICPCDLVGDAARFAYVQGETLFDQLVRLAAKDAPEEMRAFIETYIDLVTGGEKAPFSVSQDFMEFFGSPELPEGLASMRYTNLDMVLDNLIVTQDGGVVLIDYEWCFDFPIPVNYMLYRSLFVSFEKARRLDRFEAEILPLLGLTEQESSAYQQMEKTLRANIYDPAYPIDWYYDALGQERFYPVEEYEQFVKARASTAELNRIMSSNSWKFMTRIWKIRDVVLPKESRRRAFLKRIAQCVKGS